MKLKPIQINFQVIEHADGCVIHEWERIGRTLHDYMLWAIGETFSQLDNVNMARSMWTQLDNVNYIQLR